MPLSGPPCCMIQMGKHKSVMLANAVIEGCGGQGVTLFERPADEIPEGHTPVFIGINPRTSAALHEVKRRGIPFVTIDNGYFRPWREGGYLRATTNAIQWIAARDGKPGRTFDCLEEGKARYDTLELNDLQPWRNRDNGGPILIAMQSRMWYGDMRVPANWLDGVMRRLKARTRRPIIVRDKPGLKGSRAQPPLEEHLEQCSAVVGWTTMVLLKAAMQGIPIVAYGYCAVSPFAGSTIDSLFTTQVGRERESVLHALAANQWTIPEIASGKMWRDLQERYEPEFLPLA